MPNVIKILRRLPTLAANRKTEGEPSSMTPSSNSAWSMRLASRRELDRRPLLQRLSDVQRWRFRHRGWRLYAAARRSPSPPVRSD